MSNIFKKTLEKWKEEAEEQKQREARLKELEEGANNKKGFHIPNPIQAVKEGGEKKKLKKEIEAYKNKRKKRITMTLASIGLAFCFILLGVLGHNSGDDIPNKALVSTENEMAKNTSSTSAVEVTSEVITEVVAEAKTTELVGTTLAENTVASTETIEIAESSIVDTEPASEEETIAPEMTTFGSEKTEEETEVVNYETEERAEISTEIKPEEPDILELTVKNITVSSMPDFGHINLEAPCLGNNEGITIWVTASKSGVSADDIVFEYDDTLLKVAGPEITDDGSTTELKYYVTGKKAGFSRIFIYTLYDLITDEENLRSYIIELTKLNNQEGRIVYVTPTGTKYHYSAACAGDNYSPTTLHEAKEIGLDPCKKCAK